MKRLISCLLFLCLFVWAGFAVAQNPEKEKAAVAAAEAWLSLIDSGRYEQSWEDASEYFRNAITQQQWDQSLKAIRPPLGQLISREVISAVYTTTLPGAPDGEYVVIQYQSSFGNKKSAVETVTPMLDQDGAWRVSGYFIR
ncbi:MAG TPA: DUF4019 domain-containing protein [Candidatus Omnitrophota bacterium]|nr:DUF4019 domain-containing protein [Candidatus Omnitrophota bacterium]HPB68655.1 DUF4019 domain-containing protein [Candidatus Omnitrophota bacterium]HQO58925.1 DUF4019 domain-containing protein [Candidatus Omnitrophota bacterium]HQP12912.1 DUF4019 domain-containing protein [Candidatus Omnitrophota bacterium]